MQFGIKSLLGAMVLVAAFVMGVFQFSEKISQFTLLVAHLLAPALWFGAFYGCQVRGLKTFFLCGIVTGIVPWMITLFGMLEIELTTNLAINETIRLSDSLEQRFFQLVYFSISGVISIIGGLLGYWVQTCCKPASAN